MGRLFTYIADAALRAWPYSACWLCDREGVAAYPYLGFVARKDGDKEEVEAVCADCLCTNDLRWTNESELPAPIRESGELLGRLRQTPRIPLMLQYPDWPVCCGDLCEFRGSPGSTKEMLKITDGAIYWERGLGKQGRDFNFAGGGPPESFDEVSEFGCLTCREHYWMDQFT